MKPNEFELVKELFESEIKNLTNQVNLNNELILSKMDFGFETVNKRIDAVIEQKLIQNGRLGKLELKVEKVNKRTNVWQFIQTKPLISIFIGVLVFGGVILLSKYFTFKELVQLLF